MERIHDNDTGEDLGTASVETRGGFVIGAEQGGKLNPLLGLADDD